MHTPRREFFLKLFAKQEKYVILLFMGKDSEMISAAVFLDLSRDTMFSPEQREIFRKAAMARGAARLEIEIPKQKKSRRQKRRSRKKGTGR